METGKNCFLTLAMMTLVCIFAGCSNQPESKSAPRSIVTPDTILSGMITSLLPPARYHVEAIIPPGQCPGHYDVKLSDIEKMKNADLMVSYKGMAAFCAGVTADEKQFLITRGEHNWMVPEVYLQVLAQVAGELSQRFPAERAEIIGRLKRTTRAVTAGAQNLTETMRHSEIFGKPVIGSLMQREMLEWMGFRVIGEYGRQEAISTRQVARLIQIGRDQQVALVVDNRQSGPDTGKTIAEALGAPCS